MATLLQNVILKGSDNPIIIDFAWFGDMSVQGLLAFSKVSLEIGDEEYNSIDNPQNIKIKSATELEIDIGIDTQLDTGLSSKKSYIPTITGFNVEYPNGYVLQSPNLNILAKPIIIYDDA